MRMRGWHAEAALCLRLASASNTEYCVRCYPVTLMQPTYSYSVRIRAGPERKKFRNKLSVFCQGARY